MDDADQQHFAWLARSFGRTDYLPLAPADLEARLGEARSLCAGRPIVAISALGGDLNRGENGAPGTIYLKDNAKTLGDVIIDNNGVASGYATPLKTAFSELGKISVRDRGRTAAPSRTGRASPWVGPLVNPQRKAT